MIYKRYPKYKDSGEVWLGDIPEHWSIVKFNLYVNLRHGYQFRDYDFTPEGIKIIKITQLLSSGELDTENVSFIDKSRLSEFEGILISDGDILMALTGGTIGKIIKVKYVQEPLLQNYRVGNFFPSSSKLNKNFLFWILSSNLILEQIFYDQRETGQPNIGKDDFNRMFFILPDKREQVIITSFLDRETARIDALIEKKKRQIELLKEKRAALISHAVTKGLDPNVKMKDSGVEWLGEIPATWTVLQIRRVTSNVTDGAHISPDTTSQDYPFISTVDISNGVIDFESCLRTSTKSFLYMKHTGCCPGQGDILFSKDGTVGRTAIVRDEFSFAVASSLVILSPDRNRLNPIFLNYWLNGSPIQERLGVFLAGTALRRISVEKVSRLLLLLPPIAEQRDIVSFLERETSHIDKLVKMVQLSMATLREYRTALISAAVTGKIDVREDSYHE